MIRIRQHVLQIILLTASILMATSVMAEEISFNERFVLDANREEALKTLIPGTEDYYYYHALHHELAGRLVKAKKMIDAGVKKYGHNPRLVELENRYVLKDYSNNEQESLEYLTRKLNLHFNHRQQKLKKEVSLPTTLDARRIAFDTLANHALKENRDTERFENSAFDHLVTADLTPDQRRSLLSRLRRPDYPGIVKLIIDDLNHTHSNGFLHHEIHGMLTLDQLEECLQKKPELIKETNFINTYLTKLRPNDDVDWQSDINEYAAYLQRLLTFANRLPVAHISLTANIIYRQLLLNIQKGRYDKDLFMRYIQLPRQVHYINNNLLNRKDFRDLHIDLNASYASFIALPAIINDEPVVKRHLFHFLADSKNVDEYADYIEYNYLKRLFAEVKLVNGIGDAEQWYALMDNPSLVKQLRDRIDIEILPTNNNYLQPADEVTLDVAIKNIQDLTVKVFEINTTGYYRQNLSEITTDIELDGLVANTKFTRTFSQPPMLLHIEKLHFPEIEGPGVYVIELVGNGVSSRALIRKGRLTYTERIGAAGHVFMLYDESNNLLSEGRLWIAGTEYQAVNGEIRVPFSENPQKKSIVLTGNNFSALSEFQHLGEEYSLKAAMFLGREQLVAGRDCTLTIRPELLLNGEPVDIALLEEPILTIRSFDLDGHSAEKQINSLKLNNLRESTYTFRVPERFRSMTVVLSGRVQNLSTGKKVNLMDQTSIGANEIQETDRIEDVFLRSTDSGFIAELLGQNGEAHAGRAIHLEIKHRDFRRTVTTSLKTDEKGRAYLGNLNNITWIRITSPENTGHTWQLPEDKASHAPLLHMLTTGILRLPVMHTETKPLNRVASFLETRNGVFVRDCQNYIQQKDGYLVIQNLPPGDYSLMTKPDEKITTIRVTKGVAKDAQLLGDNRILEQKSTFPLQIEDIAIQGKDIVLQLANSTPGTRVHMAMTRYVTDDLFEKFGSPSFRQPAATRLHRPESQYLSGRKIGDEYRYVMERKNGKTFPGNMLTRPSLLLNPWSPRSTEQGEHHAAKGESYANLGSVAMRSNLAEAEESPDMAFFRGVDQFSSFDFFGAVSPITTNLIPDGNGVLKVALSQLPVGQQLHVYAVNSSSAVYRQTPLAEHSDSTQDLRLTRYLAPDHHYTEQKRTSVVSKGESFTVSDILSARIEAIDSVASAYRLLTALSDDATLAEFNFITNWPDHSDEKKRELYKKFACHELHLFLAMKDPAFFTEIVRPYLANKKNPTFIDDRLLDRPLRTYLDPWSYNQLNMAERALLAQQMKSEHKSTARHLKDLYDLLPPNLEEYNRLFDSVLRSSGLEGDGQRLSMSEAAAKDEDRFRADDVALGGSGASFGAIAMDVAPSPPIPAAQPMAAAKPIKGMRRAKQKLSMPLEESIPESVLMDAQSAPESIAQIMKRDMQERQTVRQLYRKLEETKEWVENNYYQVPSLRQNADLVRINGFWKDFAEWNGDGKFLSGNLPQAANSFTEIMLALAILDLPFAAGEHDYQYIDGGIIFTAGSDVILFHKQIQKAAGDADTSVLLVNQSFFASDDRYRYENNEQFDKFVTGEFEKGRVYGCQLVITNPTSTRRKVDILRQIPAGSIAVLGGSRTKSTHAVLEPYSTLSLQYFFYFPREGTYKHFPVHIAQNETIVAAAAPFVFNVVAEVDRIDKDSWEHVSQWGSDKDVIKFLDSHNINRLNLDMIAWRMRDKGFFAEVASLLKGRKVYNNTLWSYSLYHNQADRIREYLPHTHLAGNVGKIIESPLLTLDQIDNHIYEHKEYWPLVNARVLRLGDKNKILNHQFFSQYESFLKALTYRRTLTVDDKLAVAVYMLLQDRVEEAMTFYQAIDPANLKTKLQYDYVSAYMSFYREDPIEAKAIALPYKNYPVDRWRNLFTEVLAQADEIAGKETTVVDAENRTQTQTLLADTAPHLQLEIEGSTLKLEHANVKDCRINYYPMDLELLFSREPFVQDVGTRFTFIKPASSENLQLSGDSTIEVNVPEELQGKNLMIEATASGVHQLKAYYPNTLRVDILKTYGQLKVADKLTGKAIAKVYVKVYARGDDGKVTFFKDGYTDLRGRFDYTSLNSDDMDSVSRFAILVMSDKKGAMVQEVAPPLR